MPPHADPATVKFFLNFCNQNLSQYGVLAIYLIGSRARGNPRANSDHDFFVVVADNAPDEIKTAGLLHTEIYNKLCKERVKAGVGKIDMLIKHASEFAKSSTVKGSFSHATMNEGIRLP